MICERSPSSGACSDRASRIAQLLLAEAAGCPPPSRRWGCGAAVRDADVGQPAGGGEHVVEVHQRVAHAHEDEVARPADAAEGQHLVEGSPPPSGRPNFIVPVAKNVQAQRAAGFGEETQIERRPSRKRISTASTVRPSRVWRQRLDRAVGRVAASRARAPGSRTGRRRRAARAGRPAGRSSGAAGRAARRPAPHLAGVRKAGSPAAPSVSSSSARSIGPRWWQRRAPRQVPRPLRVASRRTSEQIVFDWSRERGGEVVTDPARDVDGSVPVSVDGKPTASPPASAPEGRSDQQAARRVSTGATRRGLADHRRARAELRRLYPVGVARRRHHRPDPADRRTAIRAPADAPVVRGPRAPPRERCGGRPCAQRRCRRCGGRRAGRRPDRAGEGEADRGAIRSKPTIHEGRKREAAQMLEARRPSRPRPSVCAFRPAPPAGSRRASTGA